MDTPRKVILAVLLVLVNSFATTAYAQSTDVQMFTVVPQTVLSLRGVLQRLASTTYQASIVQSSFTYRNSDITDFFTIDPKSTTNLKDYLDARTRSLKHLADVNAHNNETIVLENEISISVPEPAVASVIVFGPHDTLGKLQRSFPGARIAAAISVNMIQTNQRGDSDRINTRSREAMLHGGEATVSINAVLPYSLLPYTGSVSFGQATANTR